MGLSTRFSQRGLEGGDFTLLTPCRAVGGGGGGRLSRATGLGQCHPGGVCSWLLTTQAAGRETVMVSHHLEAYVFYYSGEQSTSSVFTTDWPLPWCAPDPVWMCCFILRWFRLHSQRQTSNGTKVMCTKCWSVIGQTVLHVKKKNPSQCLL